MTTSPGRGDRLPLLSLTMPRGTRYTLVVVMLSLAALVVALLVVILGAGGRSVGGALEATVGPLESPAPVPATGVVEPAQPAQSDARSSRSPLVAEKRTAAALTPGRGASGAAGVSSNDEGIIALVDRAKDLEAAGAYREAINILERALLAAPASPVLRAAIDRTRAAQGAEIRVYLNSADRYLALPIPDYQAAIGAYQSALRLGAGADVQAALKQALAEYDVMRKVLGRGGGGGSTPDGDIK